MRHERNDRWAFIIGIALFVIFWLLVTLHPANGQVDVKEAKNRMFVQSTYAKYEGTGKTLKYTGTLFFDKEHSIMSFSGGLPDAKRNGRPAYTIDDMWFGYVTDVIKAKRGYLFTVKHPTGQTRKVYLHLFYPEANQETYAAKYRIITGHHAVEYSTCKVIVE